MPTVFNVLMIDDHLLILDSYKNALLQISSKTENISFKISTATNCNDAIIKLEKAQETSPYHLIFLEIRLPPSKDNKIVSGEDLGEIIRQMFKNVKIIVSTACSDKYHINNILRNVNPDAFLIKEELTFSDLSDAINAILNNKPYFCKTVLEFFRKHHSNGFTLDSIDRLLLYELSKGSKMKDLPKTIHLSIAGLERRKRLLKETFNIHKENDKVLIKMATDHGFL